MPIHSLSTNRVRKVLLRLLCLLSFFIIVVSIFFNLASSPKPSFQTPSDISPAQIREIQNLFLSTLTSSTLSSNIHNISLDSDASNLILRYLLSTVPATKSSQIRINLGDEQALLEASVPLVVEFLGLKFPTFFFNIYSVISPTVNKNSLFEISSVSVGSIPVPNWALQIALSTVVKTLNADNLYTKALLGKVELIGIQPEALKINLVREPNFLETLSAQAQTLFITTQGQTRRSHYSDLINKLINDLPPERRAISINALLVPLAASAYQKSVNGADPISENRALLSAIASYVNDPFDVQSEGPSRNQTARRKIEVRLHRRQDLAQHVSSAAAITASFGSSIAEMISNTKEIYDARFGSGFSFSDLTANTVGIKLASLMTETPTRALAMQLRLSEVKSELDYMPFVGSNIDGIREEEFINIYQDRSSKQYLQKIYEITDLVNSLALFAKL